MMNAGHRYLIGGLFAASLLLGAKGGVQAESQVNIPAKPAYMGSAACSVRCHDPWYQAWKDTPHAKTYELLKPGVRANAKTRARLNPNSDYTKNPDCLRCHSTGYGQKGGFIPGETFISNATPDMEAVGCEMCHTARGGSQAMAFMKETAGKFKRNQIEAWGLRYDYENVCRRCHGHPKTPHMSKYGFNYKERKKQIHDYEKYYNESNKAQTYNIKHGEGVTEKHPLAIEDWDIVDGKIRFKKLPLWDGWLIFKRK